MTSIEASSDRPAPIGAVRGLVGLQLYVVVAYLAGAVLPYLWAPRAYPPTELWIVPGWLLGVPGFYIALLGPIFAALVAGTALAQLALRRSLPPRLYRWCIATAVLTTALALFMLTPLGQTIAVFTAD
ncbi:hypothetical protein M1L60_31250 [Actinoplanes sp. TRM 88003]|uniref:Sensor histidine kinase n=1 Tax=Paractinoplanes aksuensis TaxID=2939490 RepID=A0ABT1DYU5_9ACTN|nr:hypothetical protein [Actinoplanes aksuensis]MCO8275065.1 hypothetical protein [Actinoplanes aksuensis]